MSSWERPWSREQAYGWSDEDLRAYADCAARWWADLLRSDVRASLCTQGGYLASGDAQDARNGIFGDGLMALIRKDDPPLTLEQIARFEELLAESVFWKLVEQLERQPQSREPYLSASLSVDYQPDDLLYAAAVGAEIPRGGEHIFPIKTRLHIRNEEISASLGYRAPYEPLFESKKVAVRRLVAERLKAISPYKDRYSSPPKEAAETFSLMENRAGDAVDRLPSYFAGSIGPVVERCYAAKDVPPRHRLHYELPGPMPQGDLDKIRALRSVRILNETARTLEIEGGDSAYGDTVANSISREFPDLRWTAERLA